MASETLKIKTAKARSELAQKHGLSFEQTAALPNLEDFSQKAQTLLGATTAALFASIGNRTGRLDFDADQKAISETLNKLAHFMIDVAWEGSAPPTHRKRSKKSEKALIEKREQDILGSYQEFLSTIVENRGKPINELPLLDTLLRLAFPLPADPIIKRADRPKQTGKPKTKGPERKPN